MGKKQKLCQCPNIYGLNFMCSFCVQAGHATLQGKYADLFIFSAFEDFIVHLQH